MSLTTRSRLVPSDRTQSPKLVEEVPWNIRKPLRFAMLWRVKVTPLSGPPMSAFATR